MQERNNISTRELTDHANPAERGPRLAEPWRDRRDVDGGAEHPRPAGPRSAFPGHGLLPPARRAPGNSWELFLTLGQQLSTCTQKPTFKNIN